MDMDTGADQETGPRTATWLLPRLRMADAWVNIALAVLSGVLTGLAFPPFEYWPLAWVALVPLLVALRRTPQWRFAGYLALLFGMSLCAVSLHWMTAIFGPLAVGVFFLASLPWLLFGLAYRTLSDRSQPWLILLMTPVLWLAVDWIRCDGWYFEFSWLQLGFTVVPWGGARAALYPLIGVYGMTYLIMLVNVVIAGLILTRQVRFLLVAIKVILGKLAAILIIAVLFVLVSALVTSLRPNDEREIPLFRGLYWTEVGSSFYEYFGGYQQESEDDVPVRALLVQSEDGSLDTNLTLTKSVFPHDQSQPLLIVWPEYALPEYPLEDPLAKADLLKIQQFARETRSTMVFGTKTHAPAGTQCDWLRRRAMLATDGGLFYNTAVVVGTDGNILGTYHKTHPIQFFSDGVPGQSLLPIGSSLGKLGISICYDFDFASTTVSLVRKGANVLVTPTYDALSWGEAQHRQHSRMAQARAAEANRWVVRATTSGISQIIDNHGNLQATIPFGKSGAQSGDVELRTIFTPYVRFTWLLPYLCLAAALCWALWVAVAAVRGRRKKAAI
ncbi:MAG: apolipoprotein N-acyltransferase [Armatimonadota bacterium]